MTFLALDYGVRRLGLALSDTDGRLALPFETQTRRPNDPRGDVAALLALIRARGVEAIVLGIPGGSAQSDETAKAARRFASQLEKAAQDVGLNLAFFETDERFSTSQAHNELRGAGVSTRQSRESGGANSIDARSAAVFLQTFLDARNSKNRSDEEEHHSSATLDPSMDDDSDNELF